MRVLDEHRLTLGEGPGYDPATGTAWWFDISERRLFTHRFSEGRTVVHDLPFAASAMAVTGHGHQLLVAEGGLYLRDPSSGALALHRPLEADQPGNRSNDARVHPCGAFWISTMSWGIEPRAGAVYHYFRSEIRELWSGLTIPNAICFAPDGATAYFADTPTHAVMSVSTDPATGLPREEPVAFLRDLPAPPDGAVTDAAGNIWIAMWGTGEIAGFDPAGRTLGTILVPSPNVSCPAFVGLTAETMLVTTARYGLRPQDIAATPSAGATFVLEARVRGRFDPPVRLE